MLEVQLNASSPVASQVLGLVPEREPGLRFHHVCEVTGDLFYRLPVSEDEAVALEELFLSTVAEQPCYADLVRDMPDLMAGMADAPVLMLSFFEIQ